MSTRLTCEGAASAFSCGSLGCPTPLCRRHGGKWALIGQVNAEDVPGLKVLPPAGGKGFATLRGGCAGQLLRHHRQGGRHRLPVRLALQRL